AGARSRPADGDNGRERAVPVGADRAREGDVHPGPAAAAADRLGHEAVRVVAEGADQAAYAGRDAALVGIASHHADRAGVAARAARAADAHRDRVAEAGHGAAEVEAADAAAAADALRQQAHRPAGELHRLQRILAGRGIGPQLAVDENVPQAPHGDLARIRPVAPVAADADGHSEAVDARSGARRRHAGGYVQ